MSILIRPMYEGLHGSDRQMYMLWIDGTCTLVCKSFERCLEYVILRR